MAPTEAAIRTLTPDAMPGCLSLSAEAGWNQVAADWEIFFQRGSVFGVRNGTGEPIASGAILPFADGGFGWISMVLVTAAARGQGFGTHILRHCMTALRAMGLCPVLDATPAGERIYAPLGFRVQFGLTRWRGMATGTPGQGGLPPMTPAALPALAAADHAAFGADRGVLLRHLLHRAPAQGFRLPDGSGFVLARPGRQAIQIGPIVAPEEGSAARLLNAALAAARGPVILDLADRWASLAELLRARDFRPERPFRRMAHDRAEPFGDPARLMVAAGPELG
ncbi:GNAT family N-acetyltransferase [Muricoccus radiodurans]|uniref:GNAT family N-acetyltransferase n=1 Tax=Muricoccus radiodurans TaxID=2231721 RepID=UPI003CF29039